MVDLVAAESTSYAQLSRCYQVAHLGIWMCQISDIDFHYNYLCLKINQYITSYLQISIVFWMSWPESLIYILRSNQIYTYNLRAWYMEISNIDYLSFLQVFIAVTTTKSMQSVTNIFIVNLAMADMLVMLFCAPPSVIWDVTNTWIFGSVMCKVVIYIQVRYINFWNCNWM